MIISKTHIIGLNPRKILGIKDLNTIVFQGEYGYVYEFEISSQLVRFLSDEEVYKNNIGRRKDMSLAAEIESCFCGLVFDYIRINGGDVICCTSEGLVHWLSKVNKDWIVLHELRITMDRLISIYFYEEQLFLISHSGDLYQVSISTLQSFDSSFALSGIWGFHVDGTYLYSGSADGKLSIYDNNTLTFLRSYSIKSGWVNAVHNGYLCTSAGTIYTFHERKGVSAIYCGKGNYWFNDLCIVGKTIVAVTAEGIVICCNSSGCMISQVKITLHQLISICSYQDKLYIASVNGEIFIGELINDTLNIQHICKIKSHITCICISSKRLVAATIEGEIYIIDLMYVGTTASNYSNLCYKLSLASSRIWKITAVHEYIYGASVSGEVFKIHIRSLSTQVCKTNYLITALVWNGKFIILGTREGNVHICDESQMEDFNLILETSLVFTSRFHYENKQFRDKTVRLHTLNNIDFNGRLIDFLARGQYAFKIEQHSSDEQITKIEWWKYPYITFGERFLASGMLLDEFYKQHVIERLINNVRT